MATFPPSASRTDGVAADVAAKDSAADSDAAPATLPPAPASASPSAPPAPLTPAEINALILDNQAALLAYARSLVRDEHAARDIVQDTYLRLCRTPPDAAHAKFWLFRVCRTRAIDWWRTRHEQAAGTLFPPDSDDAENFFANLPDENTPLPGATLQYEEELDEVMRHVARLPARQRELVRLKFQADLSYKEIAATTGLTVTNVGFILHTAIHTLRNTFTKTANPPTPAHNS